jgi:predicted ATPase
VTLTATGGVGKTRLSLQAAHEVARDFPQGPVFVALAPLADPALLPAFLATALGIREEGRAADTESLLPSLARRLSAYPALLVLDNCEHLVGATSTLCHALLLRCPDLHILATSRQRLGLTGEVLWRVPSLPAPDPAHLPAEADRAIAEVLEYPAVRLFVERAGMVRGGGGGFRLAGREETEAVARLCQRLDGIPLAIELAAARAGALTVSQIASRLDDRFRLLTGAAGAA